MRFRRAGQSAQIGQDAGGSLPVFRAQAGRRIQHRLDLIAGGERQIDQVASNGKFSLAQLIECRFQVVGESGDVLEAGHRARSLDGMQRTERAPDQFQIAAVLVQFQQRRFQFREQFPRFVLECLLELVDQPMILFTTASICCLVNGFTIQPVAPAALPSRLLDS